METQSKFSILPLFLISFMDMIGIGIIIPLFGPIFLDASISILPASYSYTVRTVLLGLLIAAYPFAQFFGAPLLGAWSDRHGRKSMLLVSLTGTVIGYLLFGYGILIGNLPVLFLSRLLAGFTGGNISIVLSAVADISDESAKAKNFGLIGMAFGLGFILGPLIGGKLADSSLVSWFNYATPLWFAASLSFVNIVLLLLIFRETLAARIESKTSLLTGFRNISRAFQLPNLRVMFIVMFILTLGFNFFAQFFQVFLIQKFSYTESKIGDLFAYIGLWIAIAQGVITRLASRKFSPQQVMNFSVFFLAIALMLILVPENPLYMYLILPLVAICQGLIFPNSTAIISNLADKSSQGEILGINQSMQSLAQAMTPIISGFVVIFHMNLPIIISSILTLIGGIVFVMFFGKKKEELFAEV
ncbi:MFS transporter [Candidatus Woesearchaeota archaeon]|nr:MFS transporter [Candidatus Woesearchaeota archaeon]